MNLIRIIILFLLLLSGNTFGFTVPLDKAPVEKENGYHISEDYQELSYSNLTSSFDLYTKKIPFPSITFFIIENSREISRSKSYFSSSHLIEPGLGLEDIIFPFHFFL